MPKVKEPVTKGHAGTWYKAYACQDRVQYGIWGALTELRQALLPIDFASCDHTFTKLLESTNRTRTGSVAH